MPINASIEYKQAEGEYLSAETLEDKIEALKKLISVSPSHKGAENLRANLKRRLAKLKDQLEQDKAKKKRSGKREGIKKTGDAQVIIIGFTNTGKSSLLSILTNAKPKIAPYPFTTTKPEIGAFNYNGCEIQLIELPPITGMIENDSFALGMARDASLIIALAVTKKELEDTLKELKEAKINRKVLAVMNKTDLSVPLAINIPHINISCKTKQNLEELKQKIFENLDLIRIYTKEPGRKAETRPMIMKKNTSVRELCGKIRKDFISRFIFAKIQGKSVKFSGQQAGLEHKLEDKDIVEIHLKD